jgi:hypothetical protein
MQSPRAFAVFAFTLGACGPTLTDDQVAEAVRAKVAEAVPAGRVGVELLGRSRWVRAGMFDAECLQQKDLAFSENPAAGEALRISPTYENQRFLTADTEKGWCVLLGEGGTAKVGGPVKQGDAWVVPVTLSLAAPTPWGACLADRALTREVKVTLDEAGAPVIDGDVSLPIGACPVPMPAGESRGGSSERPTERAPKAPTQDEVIVLMTRFNDALVKKDRVAALAMTSCYNLYEEKMVGSCTPAELLQVGAHGESAGTSISWLENVVEGFSDIGAIRQDNKIPTMYHVLMTHKRTKRDRSMSVEWVGGEWRLVGVVGAKGADLTSARFVYDLHKNDRRDIFLRRLNGEKIDEQGLSTEPEVVE